MSWALVWTAPGAEKRASLYLTQQNFEHHVFRLRERCVQAGRIVWADKYLFPRYIFARANNAWERITNTPGVVDVVRVGTEPAKVSEIIIEELLSRRDSDGMVSIGPTQWTSRFKPGQSVRVNEGPLVGYTGAFDSIGAEGRVRVLLEMMGAQTPVELSESDLSECVVIADKKYRPRRRREIPTYLA